MCIRDRYDIGYIYGAFFPAQIIAGMYQPVNTYMTCLLYTSRCV